MSEWAKKQYSKIQDFVIYNKLYKGKSNNLSHADIVIDLAKKQLEAQQKDSADECTCKNIEHIQGCRYWDMGNKCYCHG